MSLFSVQWKLKKFHLIKEYLKTTRGNVVPSGFGPRITTSKARSFGLKVSTPVYTKNWHELSRIFINIAATPTAVSSFFLVAFFSRLCQTCVSRYLGCSLSPHVTSKVTMQISPRRPDRRTDRKHRLSTIRLVDSVPILSYEFASFKMGRPKPANIFTLGCLSEESPDAIPEGSSMF